MDAQDNKNGIEPTRLDDIMLSFGQLIMATILFAIAVVINAFVFMQYWAWFIVGTFEISSLNLFEAIGIILMFNYFKANKTSSAKKRQLSDLFKGVGKIIQWGLIALLFGWIIYQFI